MLEAAYNLSATIADPPTKARAACAFAGAVSKDGERNRAEKLMQDGVALLSDQPQHTLARVFCELRGSEVARDANDGNVAVQRAEAAARLLKNAGSVSPLLQLRVSLDLAESYRIATRNNEGNAAFARALDQLTRLGYESTETAETLFNNWGLVLRQLGRPTQAEARFRRAIQISSADGTDERVSPFVLNNLARTLEDLGRISEAADYAMRAYTKGIAAGHPAIVAQSLLARAATYRKLGDVPRAEAMLREVEPVAQRLWPAHHPGTASLEAERAAIAQARGDLAEARQALDRAVLVAEANPDLFGLPRIYLRRANLALDLGEPARARHDAERALELFQQGAEAGAVSGDIGRAQLALGRALMLLGRSEEASRALAAAVEHLRAYPPEHADVQLAQQLAARVGGVPGTR